MTHAIAFDTHAYIKKLKATGVPEEQAEIHAETLAEFIDDQIATKHDIALLQRDMKEMELRLRYDLTVRLGAISTTGIVIVAALIKLL